MDRAQEGGLVKLLIADDDPVAKEALRTRLVRWGYEVETAGDGLEAWALLNSDEEFAVALLDCDMPGLTGMALSRRVRESASPALRRLFVVLISADPGGDRMLECLDAGADEFLEKPWDARELACRLRVVERRRQWLVELDDELLRARAMTQMLDDLLEDMPICSYCKCIRNDEGEWRAPERYLGERGPFRFTHGVCPDCIPQLTGEHDSRSSSASIGSRD